MNTYACIQWYTYVSIRRCCAICREFASHSPTAFIYWEFLECAVSISWSQSRGHGCTVFFLIFFCVTYAADLNAAIHTHHTHKYHTYMHALTMEMEIRSFWRIFRTPVIVFDFRTNYGKSVLVGSSVNPFEKIFSSFCILTLTIDKL